MRRAPHESQNFASSRLSFPQVKQVMGPPELYLFNRWLSGQARHSLGYMADHNNAPFVPTLQSLIRRFGRPLNVLPYRHLLGLPFDSMALRGTCGSALPCQFDINLRHHLWSALNNSQIYHLRVFVCPNMAGVVSKTRRCNAGIVRENLFPFPSRIRTIPV